MITKAIASLHPTASFSLVDEDFESLVWMSPNIPKPTLEAVQQEVARLEAEYIKTQYARNRAKEYPSIGDQLDALFHAGVFPADMAAVIQAVKDKYPKENS